MYPRSGFRSGEQANVPSFWFSARVSKTAPFELGGHFGYLLFFSARGAGKGEPKDDREGGGGFIENPRGGGGCLRGIFWGGLNIVFSWLKCPPGNSKLLRLLGPISLRWKFASDSDFSSFYGVSRKKRPHCGLAVDGDLLRQKIAAICGFWCSQGFSSIAC